MASEDLQRWQETNGQKMSQCFQYNLMFVPCIAGLCIEKPTTKYVNIKVNGHNQRSVRTKTAATRIRISQETQCTVLVFLCTVFSIILGEGEI
jgi:hypothetical protein